MNDCRSYLLQYADNSIKILMDSDIPFIIHRRVVTGFSLLINAIRDNYPSDKEFNILLSQLNEIEDLAKRIYSDYKPYFDELGRLLKIDVSSLQWGCRVAFFIYDPNLKAGGLQTLLSCRDKAIAEQLERKPVFDEDGEEDMSDLYTKDPILDLTLQTYYCFKGLTPYLLKNYSLGELQQLTMSAGAIAAYQSHKLDEKTNAEKNKKYIPPSDLNYDLEKQQFNDPIDTVTKQKLKEMGIPIPETL